jgi:hypothetical protein
MFLKFPMSSLRHSQCHIVKGAFTDASIIFGREAYLGFYVEGLAPNTRKISDDGPIKWLLMPKK